METFVLVAGRRDAARRVEHAAAALQEVMPTSVAPLCARIDLVPEADACLAWVGPTAKDYQPLCHVQVDPDLCVAVYGEIYGERSVAAFMAQRYRASGPAALGDLDGAYAVVAIDRKTSDVYLRTDAVGVRALSYATAEPGLLVSPHLVALAATGLVELDWDLTSVASIVGVDWSVGRHSLLQRVTIMQPTRAVHWTPAGLRETSQSPLDFAARIGAHDRGERRKQCDRVVDMMVAATRRFAASQDAIRLPLTDGLDSRTVLAIFEGAGAHSKLTAVTSGVANSPDVLGAQKLAAMVGVPHRRRQPSEVAADAFVKHATLMAFLDSGDGNSKRALGPLPGYRSVGVAVSGNGGEIYRGNYYPVFGPLGQVPADPERFAAIFMQRLRATRFRGIDQSDQSLRLAVTNRLAHVVHSFAALGAQPADLADLLYLWERHGHWGGASFRRPWARGWSPFTGTPVIKAFYRIAAPLGKNNDIHARAIRRYLPIGAYLRPFNRFGWIPLQRAGQSYFLWRQAELAQRMAFKKISLKLRRGTEMRQLEQVWADLFADNVFDAVEGLLGASEGLCAKAFGGQTITHLLQQHRATRRHLDVLGLMVSVELLRRLANDAQRLARRHAADSDGGLEKRPPADW